MKYKIIKTNNFSLNNFLLIHISHLQSFTFDGENSSPSAVLQISIINS